MCELSDYDDLELLPLHRGLLRTELAEWHDYYLPIAEGSTVLDVGAGCGETARFYLMHGAARVIAIESDPAAYRCLLRNFQPLGARVLPIRAEVGKIKIDIEGAEENMDLEVHFPHVWTVTRAGPGFDQMRLLRA